MKPAPFDYVAPETVEEALDALAGAGGDATILAGGQTLLPLLALRMATPTLIVDVNRVADLAGVTAGEGATRIGAMTRQRALIADAALADVQPVLVTAARHVGHHQTRNRGTIGGSIALGEPAAELPATAMALGATIEIRSARAAREVEAAYFYYGPYSTALDSDELVTAIRFPEWPADTITVFREVARRPGDFALVGLVGAIALDGGRVARAGLAWFGMGPTPIRIWSAEEALVGQDVATIDPAGIAELALKDADPFDDHHATADYRRSVGRRAMARALTDAFDLRVAA